MGLYLFAVIAYLVALGPVRRHGERRDCGHCRHRRCWVLGRENSWRSPFLISTFSATNSVMLTAPRVFYAMANDKLFFKKLAEVHPALSALPRPRLWRWAFGRRYFPAREDLRSWPPARFSSDGFFTDWARRAFSRFAEPQGFADSLPRARISVDADDFCACQRWPLWETRVTWRSAIRCNFATWLVAIGLFLLGLPAYFFWSGANQPSDTVPPRL